MNWIVIGIGGLSGAIIRYGVTKYCSGKVNGPFPWPIFVINWLGSFLLGLCSVIFAGDQQALWRNLLNIGLLGAFTTYSTFNFEVIGLLRNAQTRTAWWYGFWSLVGGPICAWVGVLLGVSLG